MKSNSVSFYDIKLYDRKKKRANKYIFEEFGLKMEFTSMIAGIACLIAALYQPFDWSCEVQVLGRLVYLNGI